MKSFGLPDVVVDGVVEEVYPPRDMVHTYRFLFSDANKAEGFTRVTWRFRRSPPGSRRPTVVHDEGAPLMAGMVASKFSEQGAGGWAWILSDLKSLARDRELDVGPTSREGAQLPCGLSASVQMHPRVELDRPQAAGRPGARGNLGSVGSDRFG